MPHEFVIEKNGRLYTFDNYEKIPKDFDVVVKFLPELPHCDHSNAEHQQQRQQVVKDWISKFNNLMEIQNARWSSKNR
jgi:hypothetical protein